MIGLFCRNDFIADCLYQKLIPRILNVWSLTFVLSPIYPTPLHLIPNLQDEPRSMVATGRGNDLTGNSSYWGPSPTSNTSLPFRRSSDIYAQHLASKKRGFPLWIPEPNRNLPLEYQRQGISIGDVGIITPSGGFSFLFNICLPGYDPVNPSELPEGFAELHPPLNPLHIQDFIELGPQSHLASGSVEKRQDESLSYAFLRLSVRYKYFADVEVYSGLSFRSSAAEGAILTIPEGAVSRDLQNLARFRSYLEANIEHWYRYANGPLGCEVRNGDLRLVVGYDKAPSWGMATFNNGSGVSHLSQCQLHFKALPEADSETPACTYTWEYSGLAEARTGPHADDSTRLSCNDTDPPTNGKYLNQSLFIRTLNATLSDGFWTKLCQESGTTHLDDRRPHSQGTREYGASRQFGRSNTSASSSRGGGSSAEGFGTQRSLQDAVIESSTVTDVGIQLNVTGPPTAIVCTLSSNDRNLAKTPFFDQDFHPSDRLNQLLLEKVGRYSSSPLKVQLDISRDMQVPQAKMAITEDAAWQLFIDGVCDRKYHLLCDRNLIQRYSQVSPLAPKRKIGEGPCCV